MIQPTPEFRQLASRLLEHEAEGRREPTELADAGEQIRRKLHGQLTPLIGPEGFRVLLARALGLAKEESAFLQRVEVDSSSEACLRGLKESAGEVEPAEVNGAIVALFANFIWLLATFISVKLALQNLARIWPDVSLGNVGVGPQEVKSE